MRITWYFDFISPFAYLQCERLDRLPAGTEIDCRPILFAGLLKHWGHKGPAEIPAKRRFTYRQALWLTRRDSIDFRWPPSHPFNSLGVLRLAIALGSDLDAIRSIFRFIWAEGHRPDEEESWKKLVNRLNVAGADELIARAEVKATLRSNTDGAIAHGVFGVPTILVGKELFWGDDSTDMAAAYIEDAQAFDDAEMQRASELPMGIERPR